MSGASANVTSLAALEKFRGELIRFAEAAEAALVALELEARRPLDWIEDDRTRYWPQQARLATDAANEARLALERCEARLRGDAERSCYDERKALEKATRRLHVCEAKIAATRRWRQQMRQEVEELQTRIAKFRQYLGTDLVRAIATLERMHEALVRYVQPPGGP